MLTRKILSKAALRSALVELRRQGKRIVFTNGCFDILHYGHVRYLERARSFGDCLVVGLNSDSSVRFLKGKNRPVNHQNDRAAVLAALESVSFVTIFNEESPLQLISFLQPDVLVKGGDWKKEAIVGADVVLARKGKVHTVAFEHGRSTSGMIERIVRAYR